MSQETIRHLKALLGGHEGMQEREYFSCSLLEGGVPRGAITEISGPMRTELVARILAENNTKLVAWLEDQITVFPPALCQRGVKLENVLFGRSAEHFLWTAGQVLQSGLFPFVVLNTKHQNLTHFRKIQLLSEKSQTAVLYLQKRPSNLWPIHLKLHTFRGRGNTVFTKTLRRRA